MRILNLGFLTAIIIAILCIYSIMNPAPTTGGIQDISTPTKPDTKIPTDITNTTN